jgi:hypothetical protein
MYDLYLDLDGDIDGVGGSMSIATCLAVGP